MCLFVLIISFKLFGQKVQEVTVTIQGLNSEEKLVHFNKGEEYRKSMKFEQAIGEYYQVITPGDICGKESEAHYNMALCYTWLGEYEKAKEVFNQVIETYPDDGMALGFARYGLAWVAVQKEEYKTAINILQKTLDENICKDYEHKAMMQFKIGHIYLSYLNDAQKAKEAFSVLYEKYPDSKIASQPPVKNMNL